MGLFGVKCTFYHHQLSLLHRTANIYISSLQDRISSFLSFLDEWQFCLGITFKIHLLYHQNENCQIISIRKRGKNNNISTEHLI